MKKLFITIVVSIPLGLIAQQRIQFDIITTAGYEENISKNPRLYNANENQYSQTDLLINSGISDSKVSLKYDYKKKGHYRFELDGYASYKNYFSIPQANLVILNLNPYLRKDLDKYKFIYLNAQIRKSFRNGIHTNPLHINIVNPSERFELDGGFELKTKNRQRWNVEVGILQKKYDEISQSTLRYDQYRFALTFKYKFDKNAFLQQFESKLKWSIRNYLRIGNNLNILDDDLLDDDLSTTDNIHTQFKLRYFNLSSTLKWNLNKYFYLKTAASLLNRTGLDRNFLTYKQYGTKWSFYYKKNGTKVISKIGFSQRVYSNRFLNENDDIQLKYQYFTIGLTFEQGLTQNLKLLFKINSTIRNSTFNGNINRLFNRSYNHRLIGIGFKLAV